MGRNGFLDEYHRQHVLLSQRPPRLAAEHGRQRGVEFDQHEPDATAGVYLPPYVTAGHDFLVLSQERVVVQIRASSKVRVGNPFEPADATLIRPTR
jgi:hypothetical protein